LSYKASRRTTTAVTRLASRPQPKKSKAKAQAGKSSNGRAAAHKQNGKAQLTARTADKHLLYQKSVQAPEVEVSFINRAFKKLNGRPPQSLREDFCGTALICAEWVQSRPGRTATGVDIDPKVLSWGRRHNIEPIGDAARRITLLQQDVRERTSGRFDVVCAFNFSYWIFKTRDEMRHYFKTAHRALGSDGLFLLDAYGGWESQECMEETRRIKGGFTYVWDQALFDPITHLVKNYIHFEFKDRSRMERAFEYVWRFWSLPELRELLLEAGFSEVQVYWDTATDDDEEKYAPRARAENQPGWLAYIVARR
jgi:SAM-dependent methyltransferase